MREGWGHLGLFTGGVETEQVASRQDLGFSPSEQGCAWSHFLGLQVLGGLQPCEGKVGRENEDEAHPTSFEPPLPCCAQLQAAPVVKVTLAGAVRLGPRRPRTVAV